MSQLGDPTGSLIWLAFSGRQRRMPGMQAPIGPSLQIVLLIAEGLGSASATLVEAAWDRWLGPQRLNRKIAQFVHHGWVQPLERAASVERAVRLTEAGRHAAAGGRDPEARWRRRWDGRWRLALFDIAEEHHVLRTRLRRRLSALGFGYLQNSVWISPDSAADLKTLLAGTAVDVESFSLIEGRPCGGETDAQIVRGAWDFGRINRDYERHLEILGSAPKHGDRARRSWLEVEWKAWCRAVRGDPMLPAVLCPDGYLGREAWLRRREKLRQILCAR